MEDPNDSGKWKPMNMLGKLIPEKDPEKQKRKKIMKEEVRIANPYSQGWWVHIYCFGTGLPISRSKDVCQYCHVK